MKTLIFFLVIISCAFLVKAQEKPDKLKSIPFDDKMPGQRNYQFDSSPQFELPGPEAPFITDSLIKIPGFIFGADGSNSDASDYFNMPIVRPGPEFSSNMPVMFPDSSVQYYILNKKLDLQMLQPEAKK